MQSMNDIFLLDTVLEAEPHSFLWKLFSDVLSPKKIDLPGYKNTRITNQKKAQIMIVKQAILRGLWHSK